MNLLKNLKLVSKKERKEVLLKLKEDLKKQLVVVEFNIRHLERMKLSVKEGELTQYENAISGQRAQREACEKQLETIEDEIKEVSE